MDQKVNKARYQAPPVYHEQEPVLSPEDLRDLNENKVKSLVYQMFERYCKGLSIVDYGEIQYKYLELWGILDLNDFEQYIPQATLIDRADVNCMMRLVKPLQKKQNIESIAKFIAVKELYQRYKSANIHISTAF
jgi:hypothetical protein